MDLVDVVFAAAQEAARRQRRRRPSRGEVVAWLTGEDPNVRAWVDQVARAERLRARARRLHEAIRRNQPLEVALGGTSGP